MTIPFWTLLVAILIPFVLAMLGDYARYREFGILDNAHPREQSARLTGPGARLWAAQQNAWEALALFAPSVFVAHLAAADAHQSAWLAIVFCLARMAHPVFYVLNRSTLRSISYLVALGCCLWLFWLAAKTPSPG